MGASCTGGCPIVTRFPGGVHTLQPVGGPACAAMATSEPSSSTSTSMPLGRRAVDPAPEYLSGNVRVKLAHAEAAAELDAAIPDRGRRWDSNIAALRQVLPADLTPAEIDARLGASGSTPTSCSSSSARCSRTPT
jgi:hypothetical protein